MIEIPGILGEIVEKRLVTIEQAKKKRSLQELRTIAENSSVPLSLQRAIGAKSGISLIAEMKRSSPSAGSLDPNLDPPNRASLYCDAGAAAISVLTEPDYFSGSIDDLAAVSIISRASRVPVLRKDFIVDEYQVHEARAAGADCILLIIACLDPKQYADLFTISTSMGMDVLVEVFDEHELDIAMEIEPNIIGINNRNLKTLKTSLSVFETLARKIPDDRIRVAESGMKNSADVERMGYAGAKAVLVGESLMKAGNDVSELAKAMSAVEVG
ncbi:MAG TPA: indole-3-glycerol phosphate synthase TrpC [Dehalococcoidia bacterium]|nr:indole-3-glycerol phosphate synthase TrpC [Dehalococcoidia bacterium]HIK89870.1 indole-3-glycerol phosphate synthase TrpC [Dehalococcoidia bacterium]